MVKCSWVCCEILKVCKYLPLMVFSSATDSESESLPSEIREHSTSDSGKNKIPVKWKFNTEYQRWAVCKKFCKSQIRKFADSQNFLFLQTFRKCGNLRICYLPRDFIYIFIYICHSLSYCGKFAGLQFADWHTSEICGFAIADWDQEFADLRTL